MVITENGKCPDCGRPLNDDKEEDNQGKVLQFLAIALFVYNMWDRIYMPGSVRATWLKRKRQKEKADA